MRPERGGLATPFGRSRPFAKRTGTGLGSSAFVGVVAGAEDEPLVLVALIVGLAALVASAGPSLALDKVTFGLNWLADSRGGRLLSGRRRRHLRQIRARRHDPAGQPGIERRPAPAHRQARLLSGRRPARQLPRRGAPPPARRGGRGFPEGPADLHVASRRRAGQVDRAPERLAGLRQRRRPVLLLRLDGEARGDSKIRSSSHTTSIRRRSSSTNTRSRRAI